MSTSTSRLGLTKPSGSAAPEEDVDIDVLNDNADRIDQMIGCILVNDGVTPSTGDLFDGAIVKERTSGIIWEARQNGGGTFDKVYIRYPFFFKGTSSGNQTITSAAGTVQANIATFVSGKNSSASQISSNRFVVPVKGLYSVHLSMAWTANATGQRYLHYMLNGSVVTGDEYAKIENATAGTQVHRQEINFTDLFAVNDTIAPGAQQTSGGNLDTIKVAVKISMIEPVQ